MFFSTSPIIYLFCYKRNLINLTLLSVIDHCRKKNWLLIQKKSYNFSICSMVFLLLLFYYFCLQIHTMKNIYVHCKMSVNRSLIPTVTVNRVCTTNIFNAYIYIINNIYVSLACIILFLSYSSVRWMFMIFKYKKILKEYFYTNNLNFLRIYFLIK